MWIFQFTCSCGARHLGRSMSSLSQRIQEQHLVWLKRGRNASIRSFIIEKLVNTDHSTKTDSAFKVLYKLSRKLSKAVSSYLHSIAKTLVIPFRKIRILSKKKTQTAFFSTTVLFSYDFYFSPNRLLPSSLLLRKPFTPR